MMLRRHLACFTKLLGTRHATLQRVAIATCQRSLCTIEDKEVEKFGRLADEWWRFGNELQPLRDMNTLRVPYIVKFLGKGESNLRQSQPLEGVRLLEVGSGGGFLSEALARLGADVTGIEPSYDAMNAAVNHAAVSPVLADRLEYKNLTLEEHSNQEEHYYDAVVSSEVIEHVADPELFLHLCCDLIRPGGHMFLTTLNRTLASLALAKYAAEYVIGVAPKGAHDWNKFVTPSDLSQLLRSSDMTEIDISGMSYNPLSGRWSWCQSSAMNYACHAVKSPEDDTDS